MLVLLPLLSFALLVEAFRRRQLNWRRSLLYASIPWTLFTALVTEAPQRCPLDHKSGPGCIVAGVCPGLGSVAAFGQDNFEAGSEFKR